MVKRDQNERATFDDLVRITSGRNEELVTYYIALYIMSLLSLDYAV